MRSINEDRLEAFFKYLEEDLANNNVENKPLYGDVALSRLKDRAQKRARFTDPTLDEKAISDFLEINSSLQDFTHSLDESLIAEARHFILTSLEQATSAYDEFWIQKPLSVQSLLDLWSFGPGASVDAPGSHPVDKMYSNWSCTGLCYPLVLKLRHNHPYLDFFDKVQGTVSLHLVRGSTLLTVPKNREKSRTIAKEPLANMCLQLAAGKYLTKALQLRGLDISIQQEKNRLLAKKGSVDGSFSTLDLSSASDMITPSLVRALFPSEWYNLFVSIRSEEILVGGDWIKLNMISTMGNGFTFPLMTMIITALIYAMRRLKNGPNLFVNWNETAVFGDDIIVRAEEALDLVSILTRAGFSVNMEKSYFSGPFRESCGGDYHNGRDITPFYVKSLSNDPEVNIAINQVLTYMGKHCVYLTKSVTYLFSILNQVRLVPEWSQPFSGVCVRSVPRRYSYLSVDNRRVNINFGFLETPLICGGYVFSGSKTNSYIPRQFKTRYRSRKARLPKGYLNGWDPLKRSRSESTFIDLFVSFLTYKG